MDTVKTTNIFKLFDADVDYHYVTTFRAELNRLCNLMLVPTAIVAIFSWLPYIPLDKDLFPNMTVVIVFRCGFSLVGLISFILHISPLFKNKDYWLLFAIIYYLEISSAVIAGSVKADPAYMGGYAMLILILPLFPFKSIHSLLILFCSLLIFIIIGLISKMNFDSWGETYGLYNVISASVASFVGVFVLDNLRKVSYEKNKTNYLTNMKLKVATMDIFQINEELKKANTLKSKLLEIAAQDLRNPLQDIVDCIRIIKDEIAEDPASTRKLNVIHNSTENMLGLITKLLKSLSIESGKLVLSRSPIDMEKLLESVIEANRPQLEKKNQAIFFTGEGESMVNGDKMLLKEVFENLLSNAIKFSYPGKSIRIEVSRNVAIVTCKIRDEGPGLNKEDKEKLFGRFQKLSAKPTGGESSTGLGLAIVKDLVEMHDGKIRVESEPGRGCTFITEFSRAGS